jgi:hypothetical protein
LELIKFLLKIPPWERLFHELLDKFLSLYGNRLFIKAFTKICHFSVFCFVCALQNYFFETLLSLPSLQNQGILCCLFPSGFSTKASRHFHSHPYIPNVPLIASPHPPDLITQIIFFWKVQNRKVLFMHFLKYALHVFRLRHKSVFLITYIEYPQYVFFLDCSRSSFPPI